MNKKQITKKQHYVPRFYLKKFSKEKGMVQILDLKLHKIIKSRSISSICYEEFFYGFKTGVFDQISQEFESWFENFENKLGDDWNSLLINASSNKITNENINTMSWFLSTQFLRTKKFREDFGLENSEHLSMLLNAVKGIRNIFTKQKWTILESTGKFNFITCDDPVIEWMPKPTGMIGSTFLARKHFLSLSPKILIMTEFNDSLRENCSINYRNISGEETMMFNFLIADSGHSFAYSYDQKELNEILHQFKLGGKSFKLYLQKFYLK